MPSWSERSIRMRRTIGPVGWVKRSVHGSKRVLNRGGKVVDGTERALEAARNRQS